MRRETWQWCLYVGIGMLLGAAAALVPFFRPEIYAWAGEIGAGGRATNQQPAPNQGRGKILPIPEPTYPPITEIDARKAKAPPRFQVRPPKGAPHIVIVLIDDIGFNYSSVFGGPIHMPTAEWLAKNGLRYNRFHTTALCSPTRMALLTGRNLHSCKAGEIMELATGFPGNTGIRPAGVATLAEMLRLWGYITGAFGKYHETAVWEVSPSGPFDRWPRRSGFDKFYGFIGDETNQWAPLVYDGVTQIKQPHDPNYHFTNDMTDKAIS